jgi:hypothetical protein
MKEYQQSRKEKYKRNLSYSIDSDDDSCTEDDGESGEESQGSQAKAGSKRKKAGSDVEEEKVVKKAKGRED